MVFKTCFVPTIRLNPTFIYQPLQVWIVVFAILNGWVECPLLDHSYCQFGFILSISRMPNAEHSIWQHCTTVHCNGLCTLKQCTHNSNAVMASISLHYTVTGAPPEVRSSLTALCEFDVGDPTLCQDTERNGHKNTGRHNTTLLIYHCSQLNCGIV